LAYRKIQQFTMTMTTPSATAEGPSPLAVARDLPATSPGRAWRTVFLVVVGAELALLYAPTTYWLWTRWTMSVWHNAHGMFVAPLVAYLAWQELREHPELRDRPGSAMGFALLTPALLLRALDAGIHTELLSAISLVLALPGLSLLFLGTERTRRIAFPLCFMVFALPIPLGITETAHLVLRQITVAAASALLPLLGVTIFTEGTTLHLGRGALQVADACSGFSTLYAALAVATLAAYTASTVWRRILVLVAAVPIAIASNIARVLFLILLVQWRGEEMLHTFLHPLSGLMTFALSLPVIFWLGGSQRANAG
jgi:eight transmembrane protein EpsH (proposed exosortase)